MEYDIILHKQKKVICYSFTSDFAVYSGPKSYYCLQNLESVRILRTVGVCC